MARSLLAQEQRTTVRAGAFIGDQDKRCMRRMKDKKINKKTEDKKRADRSVRPTHEPCLLQRFGIGEVLRAFGVQQPNQLLGGGRYADRSVTNDFAGGQALAIKLFVGAAIRAQRRAFQRN